MYKYLILCALSFVCYAFACAKNGADTTIIKAHLTTLTKTPEFRTQANLTQLNASADFIKNTFLQYCDSVSFQEYEVRGRIYKNVICSFGTEHPERIIVGAHYDVCGNQEGADDNASGIVALLELARLLQGQKLQHRLDLVAYSLEEPPFFRTEYMGSYIHAKSLLDNKTKVLGMISVEMIGFFKDEKHSQSYPVKILSLIYGNRGNYITLVKKFGAGRFIRQFCRRFKASRTIRTKKLTGPPALPGIDFSDHLNYWKLGFAAMMITDTAFYRNKNYHEATDTMETLDLQRMAKVIDGLFLTLTKN
jgi:hypothetical protein